MHQVALRRTRRREVGEPRGGLVEGGLDARTGRQARAPALDAADTRAFLADIEQGRAPGGVLRVAVDAPGAEPGRPGDIRLAQSVEQAQQRRQQASHAVGVELVEEPARDALGDGVEPVEGRAHLQYARRRQPRRRIARSDLVLAKIGVDGAEPSHVLGVVRAETERPRPLAVWNPHDVADRPAKHVRQERGHRRGRHLGRLQSGLPSPSPRVIRAHVDRARPSPFRGVEFRTIAPERMRVLITGGAGFVGAFTALELLADGHQIVAFDRRAEPNDVLDEAGGRVTLVQGDVRDRDHLAAAVSQHRIEAIVHAAAVIGQTEGAADPERMFAINVTGTLNVLEVARAVDARVVFVSTATLYGQHADLHPLTEDDLPGPVGMYDTTKLMAETLVVSYHTIYGLDTVAVRPGYVYGHRTSTGGYFLDRVFNGEAVEQASGADLPMDVTYVKDLAFGLRLALTVRPLRHRVFNITGGVSRRRSEVADLARQLVPGARIALGAGYPPDAHLRGPSVLARARDELGYVPALHPGDRHGGLVQLSVQAASSRRTAARPAANLDSSEPGGNPAPRPVTAAHLHHMALRNLIWVRRRRVRTVRRPAANLDSSEAGRASRQPTCHGSPPSPHLALRYPLRFGGRSSCCSLTGSTAGCAE